MALNNFKENQIIESKKINLHPDVMTFEEYIKKEHSVPYTFDLKKGNKELFYFGTKHSNDINNPMFSEIKKKFEEKKPEIVFVEGIESLGDKKEQAINLLKTGNIADIVKDFGEAGFALKLAVDSGVDIASPEPKLKDEINYLLQKSLPKEDIFAFYLYRQINQYYRDTEKDSLEEYLRPLIQEIKMNTTWDDFDYSLENLKKIGEKVWEDRGDINNPNFSDKRTDPAFSDLKTSVTIVAQQSSYFRDRYIVQKIQETLKNKDKLFVVFGASHAFMQESALRNFFK